MTTLALIGTGRWGSNILRTLADIPDCRVKYTCDSRTDFRDILTAPDCDGVLIATPGSTHAEIALPFIQKGLPIFVEKPLTTNLKTAQQLAKAAERARRRVGGGGVMVGHVHVYNPAYQKAKELAPAAGPLRLLQFESMNNGPFRDDISALWDWAPHDIALALDLIGEKPAKVQAWGVELLRPFKKTRGIVKLHDTAWIKLNFANGSIAHMHVSWLAPDKRQRLTIIGAKDTIVFDDVAEQKVKLFKNMGPTVQGPNVVHHEPEISYPAYDRTPPLRRELEAFLAMVRTREEPPTNLPHALKVAHILTAAEKSISLDGRSVHC